MAQLGNKSILNEVKYFKGCEEVYEKIEGMLKDFDDIYIFYFFSPSLQIEHSKPGLSLVKYLYERIHEANKNVILKIFGVITKEVKEKSENELGRIIEQIKTGVDDASRNDDIYHQIELEPESINGQPNLFVYNFTEIHNKMFQKIYYSYLKRIINNILNEEKEKDNKPKMLFIVDVSSGLQSVIVTLLMIVSNIFMDILRVKLGIAEALRIVELLVIDSNKKQEIDNKGRLITKDEFTKFSVINLKNSVSSPTEVLDAIGIGDYTIAKKLTEIYDEMVFSEKVKQTLEALKMMATFYELILGSISLNVIDKTSNTANNEQTKKSSGKDVLDVLKLINVYRINLKFINLGFKNEKLSKDHAKVITAILKILVEQFNKFHEEYEDFVNKSSELLPSQGYLYKFVCKRAETGKSDISELRKILMYLVYLYYAFFVDITIRLVRGEFDLIAIDAYSLLEKTIITLYAIFRKVFPDDSLEDDISKFSLRKLRDNLERYLINLSQKNIHDISSDVAGLIIGSAICSLSSIISYDQISSLRHKALRIHGNTMGIVEIEKIFNVLDKLSFISEALYNMVGKQIAMELKKYLPDEIPDNKLNDILSILKFGDLLKFIPIKWESIDPRARKVLEAYIKLNKEPRNNVILAIKNGKELWMRMYEKMLEGLSEVEEIEG